MQSPSSPNNESVTAQEVYTYMHERNIIMSFLGDLSHEVVTSLLSSVKNVLETLDENYLVKKKLYNVIVECLENISRHNISEGQFTPSDRNFSTIFTVAQQDDHFNIQTGNYIHNEHVPALKARIDNVNELNKEGLQSLYRKKILETPPKTGGGLGFIDMSIKSGCKITYEFKKVTEDTSFLILQTIVSKQS